MAAKKGKKDTPADSGKKKLLKQENSHPKTSKKEKVTAGKTAKKLKDAPENKNGSVKKNSIPKKNNSTKKSKSETANRSVRSGGNSKKIDTSAVVNKKKKSLKPEDGKVAKEKDGPIEVVEVKKLSSDAISSAEAAIMEAEVEEAFRTFVEEAMSINYESLEKKQLVKLRRAFNAILKKISGVINVVEQRHTELLMSILVLGDLFVDTLDKYSDEIVEHMTREGLKEFAQKLYDYRQQINLIRERVMIASNSGERR